MAMERVTVGRLVSRTFETVIGSGQAAAIYVVVLAFGDSLAEYLLALGGDGNLIAGAVVQVEFAVATVIGGYLLMEAMLKQQRLFRDSGSRRFLGYFGQGLLMALGVGLGAVLLIVPGIILAVRWILAAPLLIGTGAGAVEGIEASWRITKGHGWTIFLAALLTGLALFLFLVVGAALLGSDGLAMTILQNVGINLFTVVMAALAVATFGLIASPDATLKEVFA